MWTGRATVQTYRTNQGINQALRRTNHSDGSVCTDGMFVPVAAILGCAACRCSRQPTVNFNVYEGRHLAEPSMPPQCDQLHPNQNHMGQLKFTNSFQSLPKVYFEEKKSQIVTPCGCRCLVQGLGAGQAGLLGDGPQSLPTIISFLALVLSSSWISLPVEGAVEGVREGVLEAAIEVQLGLGFPELCHGVKVHRRIRSLCSFSIL